MDSPCHFSDPHPLRPDGAAFEYALPLLLWAKHCHYSPYHLRHLFTETIGVPPHQYLRRRRLTEGRTAAGLLLTAALGDRFLSRVRKSTGFLRRLPASLPYVPGPFPGQGASLSPAAFPGRTFSLDLRSKGRRALRPASQKTFLPGWPWPTCPLTDTLAGSKGRTAPPSPPPYQTSVLGFGRGKRCWASQPLPLRGTLGLLGGSSPPPPSGWLAALACLASTNRASTASCGTHHLSGGDAADTGHRTQLLQLGFEPRELQTAFGYPVQRMVLPANRTVAP